MSAQQAKGCVIAAPHSGSGKTLVTLGLLAAFKKAGLDVAAGKVGPDYIDPTFHEAASNKTSTNLDLWAMGPNLVKSLAHKAAGRDGVLIEGVMGLFDGADNGYGSTGDVAALLGLPVILVVDGRAQAHSAAALLHGFRTFREDVDVIGVIFNRVHNARHKTLLEQAAEKAGILMIGALPDMPELQIPSRHLGLVQANEHTGLDDFIAQAAGWIAGAINLEKLVSLFQPIAQGADKAKPLSPLGQRIAIARDEAFGFSYQHLMSFWRDKGAELLPFSPLADEAPASDADALFLPGGYPELHAAKLANNHVFKDGVRALAKTVLTYGECGGFMVLGDGIIDTEGKRHKMTGLLPITTSFAERKRHLGYRMLTHESPLPWPKTLRGHEFHYSSLIESGDTTSLFDATNSVGEPLGSMGAQQGHVLGSYAHVIAMAEDDYP